MESTLEARRHDEVIEIERANPSGARVCAALNSLNRRKACRGLAKLKKKVDKKEPALREMTIRVLGGMKHRWLDGRTKRCNVGMSNPEKPGQEGRLTCQFS